MCVVSATRCCSDSVVTFSGLWNAQRLRRSLSSQSLRLVRCQLLISSFIRMYGNEGKCMAEAPRMLVSFFFFNDHLIQMGADFFQCDAGNKLQIWFLKMQFYAGAHKCRPTSKRGVYHFSSGRGCCLRIVNGACPSVHSSRPHSWHLYVAQLTFWSACHIRTSSNNFLGSSYFLFNLKHVARNKNFSRGLSNFINFFKIFFLLALPFALVLPVIFQHLDSLWWREVLGYPSTVAAIMQVIVSLRWVGGAWFKSIARRKARIGRGVVWRMSPQSVRMGQNMVEINGFACKPLCVWIQSWLWQQLLWWWKMKVPLWWEFGSLERPLVVKIYLLHSATVCLLARM